MDLFFSTGQAARELAVSPATIRALCAAGAVECQTSPGGQYRLSRTVVEKLKQGGLPNVPRPLPVGYSPPPKRNGDARLLAPPSEDLIDSTEDLIATENLLKKRKLELELAQVEDEFSERDRADRALREAEDEAERADMAEEEAERLRQKRDDRWLRYALSRIPAGAEGEEVKIHAEVRTALAGMDVTASDGVLRSVMDGIVARILKPWRRRQQADEIASEAITSLPFGAKGWSTPTTWEIESKMAALKEVFALGDDSATVAEMKMVAKQAVEKIAAKFEAHKAADADKQSRGWIVGWASLPPGLNDHGRELATKAMTDALAKLPQGTPRSELEAARDLALAPFHAAVAEARRRQADQALRQKVMRWATFRSGLPDEDERQALAAIEKALGALPENTPQSELEAARDRALQPFLTAYSQRQEAARRKSDAESRINRLGISNVYRFLGTRTRDIEFSGFHDQWNTAEKLWDKIQPMLLKEVLDKPAGMTDQKIAARMEKLSAEHLDEFLEHEDDDAA